MHFFEVSAPFNKCISFQMGHWSRSCLSLLLCQKWTLLHTQCPFQNILKKRKQTHGIARKICPSRIHIFFSECITIWYSSKTPNHILGITPFGVGSSPLDKYCNLENLHLWILRQSNIVWTYSMHAAFFWKSMVVLAESVFEFVQHPLDMSEIFD